MRLLPNGRQTRSNSVPSCLPGCMDVRGPQACTQTAPKVSCYQLSRKEAKLEEDWLTLGDDFRTIVVADAASSSVQLLRQGSEAYNPATFFACSGVGSDF